MGWNDAGEVLLGSSSQGKHLVFIRHDQAQRLGAGWQMVERSPHNRESPLPPTPAQLPPTHAHTHRHTHVHIHARVLAFSKILEINCVHIVHTHLELTAPKFNA